MSRINRKSIRDFIERRRRTYYGLLIITVLVAVVTLICALIGFKRTNILVFVTVGMVVLCLIQGLKKGFRTIYRFRGHKKRRIAPNEEFVPSEKG